MIEQFKECSERMVSEPYELQFEDLSEGDKTQLIELYARISWNPGAIHDDKIIGRFFRENCMTYVVRDPSSSTIVGMGTLLTCDDHAFLANISIHPRFEGMRIATSIIDTLLVKAEKMGISMVSVTSTPQSVGFYIGLGFELTYADVRSGRAVLQKKIEKVSS